MNLIQILMEPTFFLVVPALASELAKVRAPIV